MADTNVTPFTGQILVDDAVKQYVTVRDVFDGDWYKPKLYNGEWYYCVMKERNTDEPEDSKWCVIYFMRHDGCLRVYHGTGTITVNCTYGGLIRYSPLDGNVQEYYNNWSISGGTFFVFNPQYEWVIDDDIPYYSAFPNLYEITEYSDNIWFVDNDIPYIPAFPVMYEFTDTPSGVWCIKDNLPYMEEFPKMYGFTDAPDGTWMVQDDEGEFYNSPFLSQFTEVSRPRRERKPKYVDYEVIMDSNYEDDVRISMIYIQPIVLDNYECNIVTEEL